MLDVPRNIRRFSYGTLILGTLGMAVPLYIAIVGSTHLFQTLANGAPAWVGDQFIINYSHVLFNGLYDIPVLTMLFNSMVMALGIAIGKIVISFIGAFAIVFFRFPGRNFFFAIILMSLMLPVEVRIFPTFHVVSQLGMLDSYLGLILPLTASATAVFLFRQFFMTIPNEMIEAAEIDGAGPIRFMFDILLPLSRTNIAALFVILFIFGWNQYLWPLLITSEEGMYTIVMGMRRAMNVAELVPEWQIILPAAVLALLPPVIIILAMQRQFVKGLIEQEK